MEKLRAWWWHRQALDGCLNGQTCAKVLEETGWMRSVGGAAPYLGLFARCGAGRETVDQALAGVAIHELPSARGCTYVVPRCDFALALKVGQSFGGAEMKVARKLGVTDAEVDRLGRKVLDSLGAGPLDPDQLRAAAGDAVRSLGEEGKKKGITTTLPLALGRLQAVGEIRRIPVNGRLDQQRYRYALWRPNPLAAFRLSGQEACTELARRYFQWAAPATLAEFQAFSGLGVMASRSAVAPLRLDSLKTDPERLIPAELANELAGFRPPGKPQYQLVGSVDGIVMLHRVVLEATSHPILERGRRVGLWEYAPAAESIAWRTEIPADAALREAVRRTEEFVRADLGDARAFSLDSPKSRAPRIAALRARAAKP